MNSMVRRAWPVAVVGMMWVWTGAVQAPAEDSKPDQTQAQGVVRSLSSLSRGPLPHGKSVVVEPLGRSETVSLQWVRIQGEVRLHIHERHTETVTIVSGTGTFRLGKERYEVGPGDVFLIPPGTVHGFVSGGSEPAGAVTTFSPPFDGVDRVFLEESEEN